MERIIEPELIDHLPPDDPEAIRVRRDLRRINFWMGHAGILRRSLETCSNGNPPTRIAELGAGDGTLLLRIARQWKTRPSKAEVVFVDQQNFVTQETTATFRTLGWNATAVSMDVFDWLSEAHSFDCILANLFLHHFSPEQLSDLFKKIAAHTKLFIACEPRRLFYARAARRSLWFIGCGAATRHDAEISIRAGFCGQELSAFWPREGWEILEKEAGMFSHLFVAKKTTSRS